MCDELVSSVSLSSFTTSLTGKTFFLASAENLVFFSCFFLFTFCNHLMANFHSALKRVMKKLLIPTLLQIVITFTTKLFLLMTIILQFFKRFVSLSPITSQMIRKMVSKRYKREKKRCSLQGIRCVTLLELLIP